MPSTVRYNNIIMFNIKNSVPGYLSSDTDDGLDLIWAKYFLKVFTLNIMIRRIVFLKVFRIYYEKYFAFLVYYLKIKFKVKF